MKDSLHLGSEEGSNRNGYIDRGGFIAQIMDHRNSWSLRQIRYSMYVFFRTDLILSVDTHALKR